MTALSNYAEDKLLDTFRGNSFSVTNVYVQLHTGDPGETGANSVAGESTRKLVTFAAPSGNQTDMASNAAVSWTSVSTTETYSHISLWDASTAGNCLFYGALDSSQAITSGDDYEIASGDLTLRLT